MVNGKIRVYGVSLGNGSWARVTAGICQGLTAYGFFAGFVPVDAFEEDETYAGHDASLGLVIGPPAEGFQLASAIGWHRQTLVLLAPNSTWLPPKIVDYIASNGGALGAPSAWGASVINDTLANVYPGGARAFVYQHGVSDAFTTNAHDEGVMDHKYQKDIYRVLHLSSSTGQRKGTRELVHAWQELKRDKHLPGKAYLDIIYNGHPGHIYAHATSRGEFPLDFNVTPPLDLTAREMSALYRQSHLVAQPSRAEGFGLVPLEAAASGVVPLMTYSTGHAEYEQDVHGIYVFSGPDAPIDDGPGAMAPELRVESVKEALMIAFQDHRRWRVEARERAAEIQKKWSWERVTETFVKKELEVRGWILKPYVGKKVLVQFKPGVAYAVCTGKASAIAPLLMKDPSGAPQPVIVAYIDGKIEQEPSAAGYPDAFALVYGDEALRGGTLRVAINRDLIAFVTVIGEQKTASPVILTP